MIYNLEYLKNYEEYHNFKICLDLNILLLKII